jgi:hypothetical protein
MISRRTPACHYGSRAEFAIIDARHDSPIETSSPAGVVRPLWQAAQSCDVRNSASECLRGRGRTRPLRHRGRHRDEQGHEPHDGERPDQDRPSSDADEKGRHQPSLNPPSNQSQRKYVMTVVVRPTRAFSGNRTPALIIRC